MKGGEIIGLACEITSPRQAPCAAAQPLLIEAVIVRDIKSRGSGAGRRGVITGQQGGIETIERDWPVGDSGVQREIADDGNSRCPVAKNDTGGINAEGQIGCDRRDQADGDVRRGIRRVGSQRGLNIEPT